MGRRRRGGGEGPAAVGPRTLSCPKSCWRRHGDLLALGKEEEEEVVEEEVVVEGWEEEEEGWEEEEGEEDEAEEEEEG